MSISSAMFAFALPTTGPGPPREGATLGKVSVHHPHTRMDRSVAHLQASKSTRKSAPYIIYSI